MLHRLDDLDLKIIREFVSPSSPQWDVRESYSAIAKKLGVDQETVRKRVKRARELGSLPAWQLMVNPHLLGCEVAVLDLEVRDEGVKERVLSQIRLVEGVVNILDFQGRGLLVTVFYENGNALKRNVELIRSICDADEPVIRKMAFPRPSGKMKTIDWKIIRAMKDDARKDLRVVATEVGVSLRTVERRLEFINERRAAFVVGAPNYEMTVGLVCNFAVFCPDERKKTDVDKRILSEVPRIHYFNTSSERYSIFAVACENLFEAEKILSWVKNLEGTKKVRMGIMKRFIVLQDWLNDQIDRKIGNDLAKNPLPSI